MLVVSADLYFFTSFFHERGVKCDIFWVEGGRGGVVGKGGGGSAGILCFPVLFLFEGDLGEWRGRCAL